MRTICRARRSRWRPCGSPGPGRCPRPGLPRPLVLRHLLETCTTVDEAVGRSSSIPIALPQNVRLVDAKQARTVFAARDITPTEAPAACAADHQHLPVPNDLGPRVR
ncbi:carcinine hydrolase/isopenicillin-N N-acyltransferase family protein [Streptomyces sp. NPDC046859]|uniref:carcinine hydrolase/isopenicillin-N N-acyltransferase family protein n=1 Tax=Streptomyces sp. NPDC046859 TaxID=3155734 RepID=UPI0033ED05DB